MLKLYGKRLSVVKYLNINGYAAVPQLLAALLIAPVALLYPDAGGFLGWFLVIVALLAVIYSIFLWVYGIVVSPSESRSTSS